MSELGTLADVAGDALKATAEKLRAATEPPADDVEALPELKNGQAVPPRRGRPPGSRTRNRSPKPEGAVSVAAAVGKAPPKTVRLNLAKGAGEQMVQGAARFPIIVGDVVGTIASKGKFQLMDYVQPSQYEECDKAFREGVLGALEIECDPFWAWPITCGLVIGSALVNAGLMYAMQLKQQAGRVPPGKAPPHVQANGIGNGVSGGNGEFPGRVEGVDGQPSSGGPSPS